MLQNLRTVTGDRSAHTPLFLHAVAFSGAAVVAAVLLAVAATDLGAQYPGVPPPPPCHARSGGGGGSANNVSSPQWARSVGIVAFQNSSSTPGDVFLGPALADALATALREGNALRVVTSSNFGLEQIANQRAASGVATTLGSRFLLSGTIGRGDQGQVSITGHLLDTRDSTTAWSRSLTSDFSNLPHAIESMASQIASVVGVRVAGSIQTAGLEEGPSGSVVEHFLRGRYYANLETAEGYAAALAQFDSAARLDPSFADAFANSALMAAATVEWGWWNAAPADAREMVDRGLRDSDKALRLDSANADAWTARGTLLTFRNPRTFAGARAAFTHSVANGPRNPRAHHWFGRALMKMGDYSGARSEFIRALSIAPRDAAVLVDLAQLDRRQGRFTAACALLDSATAVEPTSGQAFVLRALVRVRRGQLRFAWADAETGGRLGWPLWGKAVGAIVDASARDTASARMRVRELVTATSPRALLRGGWTGEYLAIALASSGREDAALDMLERMKPMGVHLWFALRDPAFAPIRRHRRFSALLAATAPPR